jgi:hypothetical protein
VIPVAQGLLDECNRQKENCEYTAVSFTIWLRHLRRIKTVCLTTPVILGAIATWKLAAHSAPVLAAVCTLGATVLPVAYRASKTDAKIAQCTKLAGEMTNLRDRFRPAATISAHKEPTVFEAEARPYLARLERARRSMLTPPEWCFIKARAKIKAGHYHHDYDEKPNS